MPCHSQVEQRPGFVAMDVRADRGGDSLSVCVVPRRPRTDDTLPQSIREVVSTILGKIFDVHGGSDLRNPLASNEFGKKITDDSCGAWIAQEQGEYSSCPTRILVELGYVFGDEMLTRRCQDSGFESSA